MAKSYATERKAKKHTEKGFMCCGKYFSGNGGANHMKTHLLEEMPEYTAMGYSYADLRQERMRRRDVATNYYGGLYAKLAPLPA